MKLEPTGNGAAWAGRGWWALGLMKTTALCVFVMAQGATGGDIGNQPKNHVRKLDQGVYYPNTYYSRTYIQDYPLSPGDRPLFFRLNPFQHYGRYRQGVAIEPGLTDGGFQLSHFPYRYKWDFQPTEAPKRIYMNPCDDPRARRWEDVVAPPQSR